MNPRRRNDSEQSLVISIFEFPFHCTLLCIWTRTVSDSLWTSCPDRCTNIACFCRTLWKSAQTRRNLPPFTAQSPANSRESANRKGWWLFRRYGAGSLNGRAGASGPLGICRLPSAPSYRYLLQDRKTCASCLAQEASALFSASWNSISALRWSQNSCRGIRTRTRFLILAYVCASLKNAPGSILRYDRGAPPGSRSLEGASRMSLRTQAGQS